jgi:hypothetical protein
MSTDIQHTRTQNSYGAVHAGEGFVYLGHPAAQGRGPLHQMDLEVGICQIQRRMNSGYSPPDNQGAFFFFFLLLHLASKSLLIAKVIFLCYGLWTTDHGQ